ncbi:GNAT family N-acetyltransferase [Mycobacterium decipiens]|uniref:GNAT family N-acetyltransferase n=1 Tax=Mycobacterium decipiens TaxID=1430326 RepID=UPI0013FD9A8B|nr:GNAT family N-acetyltransferase [Mycobacterium decipiens]
MDISGARGDFGVVAVDGDRTVAAAWALYLPASDPGYGFVDAHTPESSVWVAPGLRGRGIGRAVMGELLDRASERGVHRMSLSVEPGNARAMALYGSLGFVPVEGADNGVMLREVR